MCVYVCCNVKLFFAGVVPVAAASFEFWTVTRHLTLCSLLIHSFLYLFQIYFDCSSFGTCRFGSYITTCQHLLLLFQKACPTNCNGSTRNSDVLEQKTPKHPSVYPEYSYISRERKHPAMQLWDQDSPWQQVNEGLTMIFINLVSLFLNY